MIATRANGDGGGRHGEHATAGALDAAEPDFDASFEHLQKEVRKACARHVAWEARVGAGIACALEFAAANPQEARVVALAGWERRKEVIARFTELLRAVAPLEQRSAISSDRAILESIAVLVRAHLVEGTPDRLPSLAPDLIYLSLMPYAGSVGARAEADRFDRQPSGTGGYG